VPQRFSSAVVVLLAKPAAVHSPRHVHPFTDMWTTPSAGSSPLPLTRTSAELQTPTAAQAKQSKAAGGILVAAPAACSASSLAARACSRLGSRSYNPQK